MYKVRVFTKNRKDEIDSDLVKSDLIEVITMGRDQIDHSLTDSGIHALGHISAFIKNGRTEIASKNEIGKMRFTFGAILIAKEVDEGQDGTSSETDDKIGNEEETEKTNNC